MTLDASYSGNSVSLSYPSSWTRENDNVTGIVYFHMPSGGIMMVNAPSTVTASADNVSSDLMDYSFQQYFLAFQNSGNATVGDYTRNDTDDAYVATAPFEMTQSGTTYKGTIYCAMAGNQALGVTVADVMDNYDASKATMEAVISSIEVDDAATAQAGSDDAGSKTAEDMLLDAMMGDSTSYDEGAYMVGSDIPAGEYQLWALTSTSSGEGYFCVYPDASRSEILENENFSNSAVITLSDGQLFELNRATARPFDEASHALTDNTVEGTWKVGVDIQAGTYALTQTGSHGYWCIYSSSQPGREIIQNNNFSGNDYVTVSDGQYLLLSGCSAQKQQ